LRTLLWLEIGTVDNVELYLIYQMMLWVCWICVNRYFYV